MSACYKSFYVSCLYDATVTDISVGRCDQNVLLMLLTRSVVFYCLTCVDLLTCFPGQGMPALVESSKV